MDLLQYYVPPYILLTVIVIIIISILLLKPRPRHIKNLPPSPTSLPIIGHLHLLSLPLHRAFSHLSSRYGPIILLYFGSRPVLVVSSPSAVEECFTKNDITFANRPRFPNMKHITYNYTSLASVSYGPLLRNLRRISSTEIFSPVRIRSLAAVRQEEVKLMITGILASTSTDNSVKVNMKVVFSELMFNVIMKIIAGKRYFGVNTDSEVEEGQKFRVVFDEMFSTLEVASPEDFLPFLKWFGFKRMENRLTKLAKELDQLFQKLIEERRSERGKVQSTVIDVLLSLQETDREQYSDKLIKGMILSLIAAGTHTTAGTMEWAMSLLLNHPEALQKVRDEIEKKVGQDRLIDHSDLQNLSYLNNAIKESLRLFPTAPLLLAHESSAECTVGGFTIPSNTILFANAYALHRDPKVWTDPASFKPERFENSGQQGSRIYVPFGLGRRSCPGEGLATQVVGLALGTLIQCFEWDRNGEEKVDMTDGSGLAMHMEKPLEAMCKPRQSIVDVINRL